MNIILIILITICTLFGAYGSLYLKLGSKKTNKKIASFLMNKNLIKGIVFYILSTIIYIYLLKKIELSILYPITSLTYIWVLMLSKTHLNEKVSNTKMMGVSLIILGIITINLTI